MVRVIRFFFVLVLVGVASVCAAGGTIRLSELDPLLRQKPDLRMFLYSALDMDGTVMAAVRFGSHVKFLGGARMGPYMVKARPKTPANASPIELVLCTDTRFFDASGNVTQDETNATRLEEQLSVVMVREANSAPAIPNCP